jgi:hypothetical protein
MKVLKIKFNDGKSPTFDINHWAIFQITRELVDIKTGRHDNEFDIVIPRNKVVEHTNQYISKEIPFMNLIQDDVGNFAQVRIVPQPLQHNSSGTECNRSNISRLFGIKTDFIPNCGFLKENGRSPKLNICSPWRLGMF